MAFQTDGFLSPEMEEFTTGLRKVSAYKLWFEFAEELNRLGWEMLAVHGPPAANDPRLWISLLFVRAHRSFQAAIILSEKGILSDARAVLRSAVEGAIALHALAHNIAFVDQLEDAHHFNRRKQANDVLRNKDEYEPALTQSQVDEMKAAIREVDAEERAANRKFCKINWADVATKHCPALYQTLYRLLSNDGTHTNIIAAKRFVKLNETGQWILQIGPDFSDMVEVVQMACMAFIWAAEPFTRILASQFAQRVADKLRQFDKMSGDEPTDVSGQ